MNFNKQIGEITIPKYLRRIQLSKAQNPKYFEWNGTTIKSRSKPLFKKYIDNKYYNEISENGGNVKPYHLVEDVFLVGFKGTKPYEVFDKTHFRPFADLTEKQENIKTKFILCDKDYNKIIANPTQAGEPKWHIIKGQDLYSGLNPFIRTKIVDMLKESYAETLSSNFKNKKQTIEAFKNFERKLKEELPIFILMEIHDTVDNFYDKANNDWDVDNRGYIYLKTFIDFMVHGYNKDNIEIPSLLEDDERNIVIGSGQLFIPIEYHDNRKLIFKIFSLNDN